MAKDVAPAEGALPVLVVDDDENIGRVFQMGFKQEGFEVVYFSSARKALEWASQVRPIMAVIDVMMPDMDGVKLCEELRSRSSTSDLPVILLSAMDRAELAMLASRVGALSYICKPFAASQVFQMMRLYLAEQK